MTMFETLEEKLLKDFEEVLVGMLKELRTEILEAALEKGIIASDDYEMSFVELYNILTEKFDLVNK